MVTEYYLINNTNNSILLLFFLFDFMLYFIQGLSCKCKSGYRSNQSIGIDIICEPCPSGKVKVLFPWNVSEFNDSNYSLYLCFFLSCSFAMISLELYLYLFLSFLSFARDIWCNGLIEINQKLQRLKSRAEAKGLKINVANKGVVGVEKMIGSKLLWINTSLHNIGRVPCWIPKSW